MTTTHYFDAGMYRDCSCGWRAPQGSWDTSADLRKLWEKHVGAITQDGGPATDRLQQKAEQVTREAMDCFGGENWHAMASDYLRQRVAYRCALAGLTAGIAMAAEREAKLREALEYVDNQRGRIGKHSCPGSDCAICTEGWGIVERALAKGETQHG